jgi:hypothetical protein
MRNIPFAFINEETIDQINRAEREYVNGFAKLAETQMSMRGLIRWPVMAWIVATLEKMMSMSGPNSMANLERAMRSRG